MNNNISLPDPSDLRAFQEIAQTLNLSRAAERLGVGQPGLSLVLKRLESTLETPLFFRRHRGLVLTPAGQRLLSRYQKLQEEWTLLVTETRQSESELAGTFRLGCHTAVALYCLNPFVRDLYEKYPGLNFDLRHALSREICEGVISGSLDFGFVVNPVRHPDLVIRKLAVDEVCFWGAPGHIDEVLICEPSLSQTQALLKKTGGRYKKFINTSSLEVAASLARSGAGAAILPTRVAEALAPEVKRIAHTESFKDEITFIYREDLPKTAAVRVILDGVKQLKI